MPETGAGSWGFSPLLERGDTLYVHDLNQEAGGMLILSARRTLARLWVHSQGVQCSACGRWVLGLVEEVTRLESVWASVMCFLCHDARQSIRQSLLRGSWTLPGALLPATASRSSSARFPVYREGMEASQNRRPSQRWRQGCKPGVRGARPRPWHCF